MNTTPIVALDVSGMREALALAGSLGDTCRYFKVGSELFTAAGPDVVRALREMGHQVFLDLKLHDIPNTVHGAAVSAAQLGASLLTVHASGGDEMMRAAVEGAGDACRILGVTVLTSMDAAGVAQAWGRVPPPNVEEEVLRLAELAAAAKVHGVVCSGHEVAAVRSRHGDRLAVLVPGIRFADGAVHDQRRVITPAAAVRAGARYLVMGRAVTAAPDPQAAMRRVWAALETASTALG